MRRPGWRVTAPSVGCCEPVISRKSVVLPLPFRPSIAHRSPCPIVKVIPWNILLAPNSTPAFETDICVKSAGHSSTLRDSARRSPQCDRPYVRCEKSTL